MYTDPCCVYVCVWFLSLCDREIEEEQKREGAVRNGQLRTVLCVDMHGDDADQGPIFCSLLDCGPGQKKGIHPNEPQLRFLHSV